MQQQAQKRLNAFRQFLAGLHASLQLAFGFRLWDGSLVPQTLAPDALMVAIADEGAVAALLRRPNIITLCNLWAARRVDILNGTLFDVAARRPAMKTKDIKKAISLRNALGLAMQFLFVPRGGPWPLEAIGQDRPSDGSSAQNKQNIAHHYDVSNEFYALWLDQEMVYTCAYFHDWGDDLDTAQRQKLDMVCRKLRLKPGDHVMDIGSGWGAFCCHAAQNYGVTTYGCTLSQEQIAYAKAKALRLGLAERCTFELKDYALVEGQELFDKITSIGMMEHVGIDNFPTYYKTAHRLLKPGGLFLHHAITRPGKSVQARTGRKRKEFEALTRYIFPGGELDYIGRTVTQLEQFGFEVRDVEGWREHYGRTCTFWHDRLLARYEEACAIAGETTTRIWLAYLASCAIAFKRNNVGIHQTLAVKRVKGETGLPPTRGDLYA